MRVCRATPIASAMSNVASSQPCIRRMHLGVLEGCISGLGGKSASASPGPCCDCFAAKRSRYSPGKAAVGVSVASPEAPPHDSRVIRAFHERGDLFRETPEVSG